MAACAAPVGGDHDFRCARSLDDDWVPELVGVDDLDFDLDLDLDLDLESASSQAPPMPKHGEKVQLRPHASETAGQ